VQQRGELYLLVAAQARVGGAACGALGYEVLYHVLAEPLRHRPDVEREAEPVGDAAGIAGVLEGAAAAGVLPQGGGGLAEHQVHTDHLVAGVEHPGRRDGRVDTAAHRCDDPLEVLRVAAPRARRARWISPGSAPR